MSNKMFQRQYPTMTYRDYIRKYASPMRLGHFYCELCHQWINKHRWIHFKKYHRYKKQVESGT